MDMADKNQRYENFIHWQGAVGRSIKQLPKWYLPYLGPSAKLVEPSVTLRLPRGRSNLMYRYNSRCEEGNEIDAGVINLELVRVTVSPKFLLISHRLVIPRSSEMREGVGKKGLLDCSRIFWGTRNLKINKSKLSES